MLSSVKDSIFIKKKQKRKNYKLEINEESI